MEKTIRPQRNRRHSRRAWPPDDDLLSSRAVKRLFTPEIKRMLKEWLIRRRDNPYPSREEKKRLAVETGLTYTQICNWFANWRRKLKNSERERAKKSWGHLIKHYNSNAKGNVEQFSISSEDSIWEEEEERYAKTAFRSNEDYSNDGESNSSYLERSAGSDETYFPQTCHTYSSNYVQLHDPNKYQKVNPKNSFATKDQCYYPQQLSELVKSKNIDERNEANNGFTSTYSSNKAKYKQKIIEKYLNDKKQEQQLQSDENEGLNCTDGHTLTKWLESAANFTPNKNNYYVEWTQRCRDERSKTNTKIPKYATSPTQVCSLGTTESNAPFSQRVDMLEAIHHKDELDAAEALANLAFNCRQRILNAPVYTNINGITS